MGEIRVSNTEQSCYILWSCQPMKQGICSLLEEGKRKKPSKIMNPLFFSSFNSLLMLNFWKLLLLPLVICFLYWLMTAVITLYCYFSLSLCLLELCSVRMGLALCFSEYFTECKTHLGTEAIWWIFVMFACKYIL